MKKRSRTARADSTNAEPTWLRENFPALSSFLQGYLHQDLAVVHGSARAAAAAFCAEANPAERRRLHAELESFLGLARGRSIRDIRRFITRDLGSGWAPESRAQLTDLLQVVGASLSA